MAVNFEEGGISLSSSDNQEPGLDIGKILNEARIRHRLSLDEVSETLRIRRDYIAALEQNRWDDLPGEVYGQGFLRSYGRLIDLDGDKLVDLRRTLIGGQSTKHPLMDSSKGTGIFTSPVPSGTTNSHLRSQRVRAPNVPRAQVPQPMSSRSVLTLIVVLVGLFVAGLFMLSKPGQKHPSSALPAQSLSHKTAPTSPARSQHKKKTTSVTPLAASTVVNQGNVTIATYNVSATPLKVQVTFTGRCWVGYSADSAAQVGNIYASGQTLSLSASHSLNLVFGTHTENVTVNGHPVTPPTSGLLWEMNFVSTGG